MRKLTERQQAVYDRVQAGARIEHRTWTRTTIDRGRGLTMTRCEGTFLVEGPARKKRERIVPRIAAALTARGLVEIHEMARDDVLRKFAEAVRGGDADAAHSALAEVTGESNDRTCAPNVPAYRAPARGSRR